MYLHASIVDIKGKIAVANLEWSRLAVNQIRPHNIEL